MIASDIFTPARSTLLDPNARYWTDAELISYLNVAIAQIVAVKPSASAGVTTLVLTPGLLQSLPSQYSMLIDTLYLAGPASITPVTLQNVQEFSRVTPTWPSDAAGVPRYVFYDLRALPQFIVYPAVPGTGVYDLIVLAGNVPTAITADSDTVNLPVWYKAALWSFVVAMAYAKNSKRQDIVKSKVFMDQFNAFVSAITPATLATGAKVELKGAM